MNRKLLIVVDMQHDFIFGSLGTEEAKNIVSNVIRKIKEFDGIVIYTQDTHDEDYLQTQEGKNLPIKHCIKGTPGWEIPHEIFSAGASKAPTKHLLRVYDKPTFGCEELADAVRRYMRLCKEDDFYQDDNIEPEIEIIGLCTDICVVSNALLLKAFMPEIRITVDSSCCAGVTPETHQAAIETMKMCQINIT